MCLAAISSMRSEGEITNNSIGFKLVFVAISGGNKPKVLLTRLRRSMSMDKLSKNMEAIACPAICARLG